MFYDMVQISPIQAARLLWSMEVILMRCEKVVEYCPMAVTFLIQRLHVLLTTTLSKMIPTLSGNVFNRL